MAPPYLVTWADQTGTLYDLTNDIINIPLFTDTGSGETNAGTITVSANNGQYAVTGKPGGGIFPISQFDLIQILSQDASGLFYVRNFEVRRIIPSESKAQGSRLEIQLSGLEWHSQFSTYSGLFFISDAFTVAKDIQTVFNQSTGSLDPVMKGLDDPTKNLLPNWTANQYDFGNNEEKSYNRLLEIIDKLGAPVNAGGVFDYFDIGTQQDVLLIRQFTFKIFSSGSHDSGVIIDDSISTNFASSNSQDKEGGIDAIAGTVINGWGDANSGSLPTAYSIFAGGQILYDLYPQYQSTATYPIGALVQFGGTLYKSIVANNLNNSPPVSFFAWQNITRAQFYGNTVYSPWTNNAVNKWVDSGTNLPNVLLGPLNNIGRGFFDANIVVNDDQVTRTWVNLKVVSDSDIPASYRYATVPGNPNGYYLGLRVLVNGTGSGSFAGNDVNGTPFANSIVQYMGDTLGWVVFMGPVPNLRCAVLHEGRVYTYQNGDVNPTGWGDMFLLDNVPQWQNTIDCFHPYDSIIQDDIDVIDPTFTANKNSAIKVTYTWETVSGLAQVDGAGYYKFGAWLSMMFPFPSNVFNEPGQVIGQRYGTSALVKGPSVLDTENMTLTPDGLRGFCNGESSEALGPLSSLCGRIKIRATFPTLTGDQLAAEANFKIRVAVGDINDNVAIQDFTVPFNNNSYDFDCPLSQFAIYDGRAPLNGPTQYLVPPLQVSPVNIFEWRHVKWICFFTAESYDDNGRYSPGTSRYLKPFASPLLGPLNINTFHKLEMWVDALRFTKPLLANSDTAGVLGRNIEPDFTQHTDIVVYQQLKATVQEEYQRFSFQRQEIDIVTTLAHDINFGDTFWYRNPRLIPTQNPPDVAPDGHSANTIKVVAKRIEYGYTKPSNGSGGATRRLVAVKRFGAT